MKNEIEEKISKYNELNDVHKFRIILDAADLYIKGREQGVISDSEIELGKAVFIKMVEISFVASLHQYEHDYKLQREMLIKKIRVFKYCIPDSHIEIRKVTEMLIGMKENELG